MKLLSQAKAFLIKFRIVKLIAMNRSNGALEQINFFLEPKLGDKACIPWMNYGAIDYLSASVPLNHRVLELGGGRSTSWWVNRCNSVLTIETDGNWARDIEQSHQSFNNFEGVIFAEEATREILSGFPGKFDVIVIDHNVKRAEAVSWVTDFLSQDGIIVFDNSDRVEYRNALNKLKDLGFGSISFFGLVPGLHYAAETTVFSKNLPQPANEGIKRKSIDY